MERTIKINYNYKLKDYPEITHEQRELLEDHAEERILEMRKEGYTSGELFFESEDILCRGWWSFSYTSND